MATITLAWVQTQIAALQATYAAAAARPDDEYGINGRNMKLKKLQDLRSELMEWSRMEGELGGDSSGGMNALVQFGEQV